jgi:quercetin dioxygenase-like cupin family protein
MPSHHAAQPIRWASLPEERINALVTRRVLHTAAMTIIQLAYKRGGIVPLHHHVHAQVTMVQSGSLRMEMFGQSTIVGPGESLDVPSNAPHLAEAIEDALVVEVFVPARTDWMKPPS